ncbi:MAG: GTP-binding protein [Eubacteriaceae bacterium]|nr:GTP-binding protein [Eubacteriaceae bacterium]
MIDLILITGFLGAGKTTLMQNTLEEFSDKKTGVIVNEFGSVNIDAVLLKQEGIEMAELSNGSIFCACIKDKFVDSLIEMSKLEIDYLFIEASGLADPANMTKILAGISRLTENKYNYRGSVCVLDAENFMDLCEMLPAVAAQLEFCSAVIINKADIVTSETITEVKEKIKEFNKDIDPVVTSYCSVKIRPIIEKFGMKVLEKPSHETSNTMANRADTFIVKSDSIVPYDRLRAFLDDVVEETYRVKGFVSTDRGPVEVSTVGKNIHMVSWKEEVVHSELVLISSVGFKLISTITKALEQHLKDIMSI